MGDIDVEAVVEAAFLAFVGQPHTIVSDVITIHRNNSEAGNATHQLHGRVRKAVMESLSKPKHPHTVERNEAVSEWQDISTAPKDGTEFLASNGHSVFICRWGNLYVRSLGGEDLYGWMNPHGQLGNRVSPGAWKPLPPHHQKDHTNDQ